MIDGHVNGHFEVVFCVCSHFFFSKLLSLYETHQVVRDTHAPAHMTRVLNCQSSWRSCQTESIKALNKTCCNRLFWDTHVGCEVKATKKKASTQERAQARRIKINLHAMRALVTSITTAENCICNFKCFFGRWNWVARFTGVYVHTHFCYCCHATRPEITARFRNE